MKYIYPAKFIIEENKYLVDFLDFDCKTQGDNLNDAIEMAKIAMSSYLDDLSSNEIPQPTMSFSNIKLSESEVIFLLDVGIGNRYNNE